jgi:hypothetical protein
MRRMIVLATICLSALAPLAGRADTPTPASVAALQHAPVSMWDLGVERLARQWGDDFERQLDVQGFGLRGRYLTTENVWVVVEQTNDGAGLSIKVHLGLKKSGEIRTHEEFHRDAVRIIDQIRGQLGAVVRDGNTYPRLAHYFLPLGNASSPSALEHELQAITTIEVTSFDRNFNSVGTCTGPLSQKEFKCKE